MLSVCLLHTHWGTDAWVWPTNFLKCFLFILPDFCNCKFAGKYIVPKYIQHYIYVLNSLCLILLFHLTEVTSSLWSWGRERRSCTHVEHSCQVILVLLDTLFEIHNTFVTSFYKIDILLCIITNGSLSCFLNRDCKLLMSRHYLLLILYSLQCQFQGLAYTRCSINICCIKLNM